MKYSLMETCTLRTIYIFWYIPFSSNSRIIVVLLIINKIIIRSIFTYTVNITSPRDCYCKATNDALIAQ